MSEISGFSRSLEQIAHTDHLLVSLDFDGTLAPLVDQPEQARMLPESRAAVLRLMACKNTRVALVSGRALTSLLRVADPPNGLLCVGSHGAEFQLDQTETSVHPETQAGEQRAVLAEIFHLAQDMAEGAWYEEKPTGYAMHTRLVDHDDALRIQRYLRAEVAARLPGLRAREGHNVVEFSVSPVTKGDALIQLKKYTRATAVFYAGDDMTDEDAFAVLHSVDFGLKCGDEPSRAEHRVHGPDDVAAVLTRLAELRNRAMNEDSFPEDIAAQPRQVLDS